MSAFRSSPIRRRLIEAASEIDPRTAEVAGLRFQHSTLCQTYLPLVKPPSGVRVWERTNGRVLMQLEAGSAYDSIAGRFVPLPLPYGVKARLALIAIISEAVRAKSAEIHVGKSMTQFAMHVIGRHPAGRDMHRLRQQLAAILVASMRLGWTEQDGTAIQVATQIAEIVEGMQPASWAATAGNKGKWAWPEHIKIAPLFLEEVIEHAVPLDSRAVGKLSHSALAIDIYSWLAHRLYRIPRGGHVFFTWPMLHDQFGGFARLRDFRANFLFTLAAVKAVYRDLRVEVDEAHGRPSGLRLLPSPPPVPRRGICG